MVGILLIIAAVITVITVHVTTSSTALLHFLHYKPLKWSSRFLLHSNYDSAWLHISCVSATLDSAHAWRGRVFTAIMAVLGWNRVHGELTGL